MPSSSTVDVPHGIPNLKRPVSLHCLTQNESLQEWNIVPYPSVAGNINNQGIVQCKLDSIRIITRSAWTGWKNVMVTLEYTKNE